MKTALALCFPLALVLTASAAAVHYADANNANPVPPYTNWATAATVIQDAVDAASPGDEVVVTNGIYATGGRTAVGLTTNRVAIDKPVAMRSVNGPQHTIIQGYQEPGTINGKNAVRCVFLSTGASLSGFMLTGGGATRLPAKGFQDGSGGGLWGDSGAWASNCVVVGNVAIWGGGLGCEPSATNRFVLVSSRLENNTASTYAGGAWYGELSGCILVSNVSNYGGADWGSRLNGCIVMNNSGIWGGGTGGAVLNNCVVTGNQASDSGGGANNCELYNCTVVSNSSGTLGGGVNYGALINCIVYFNRAVQGGENVVDVLMDHCCTTSGPDSPANETNFSLDPLFVDLSNGDLRLRPDSPCINAGANPYAPGLTDIEGNPRIAGDVVDIGAYEFQGTPVLTAPSILSQPTNQVLIAGVNITLNVIAAGTRPLSYQWLFNGTNLAGATHQSLMLPSIQTSQSGTYQVQVTNSAGLTISKGVLLTVQVPPFGPRYVDAGSPHPSPPYSTLATAAATIQDAIEIALPGDEIVVTDGDYRTGGLAVYAGVPNRVVVYKPLHLRSVNGPSVTRIWGDLDRDVRCVYLTNGASLSGFTLCGGSAISAGGGGLWAESQVAMVTNCVFEVNLALQSSGGGVCGGTLFNCILRQNSAFLGGGASGSALFNCTVSGNQAGEYGGGAIAARLNNCLLTGNSAWDAGGAGDSLLANCLLTGNSSTQGAGAVSCSTLNNCTLVGNSSAGAGSCSSTFNNCIIYLNTAPGSTNAALSGVLNYCCAPFPAPGVGNITSAPQFVKLSGGDLRLQANSPCINSGNNAYASGPTDMDRNPRIVGGTVDIGAYEFQTPQSVISYSWLQRYRLPVNGSADYADPDKDGMNNGQEWLCGTDPTNAQSVLRLLALEFDASRSRITWQSATNRTYAVERTSNLATPASFIPIATNLSGIAGIMSLADTNLPRVGPAFYRVRVQP